MATEEELVIDFIVSDKGQKMLENIGNAAKTSQQQVAELLRLMQQVGTQTGASLESIESGLKKYAQIQQEATKNMQAPTGAKLSTDEIQKAVQYLNNQNMALELRNERELAYNKFIVARKADLIAISNLKSPFDREKGLASLINNEINNGLKVSGDMINRIAKEFGFSNIEAQKVAKEVYDLQNGLAGTAKGALNFRAIMQTAFGVGMAMLIFQLQMLITNFIQSVIQQVKDLQSSIAELAVFEEVASKQGVAVTGKQLVTLVDELAKKFTLVSKIDLLKATADTALRMADAGITPEQLQKVLEVANLAKISRPGLTLEQATETVGTAVLTGERKSIQGMGFNLDDKAVKQKAVELGLIKDINESMTEQEKVQARIAYLYDQAQAKEEGLLETQGYLYNASDKLAASWANFTSMSGGVVDIWNGFLMVLASALDGFVLLKGILDGTIKPTNEFQKKFADIWKFVYNIGLKINDFIRTISGFNLVMKPLVAAWERIAEIYEKTTGKKIFYQPTLEDLSKQDTPTGIKEPLIDEESAKKTQDTIEKITKWFHNLQDVLDQFADKAKQMQEDFNNSMQKMLEDFNLDYNRALEDWINDRQSIIDDGNKKIADKERDHKRKQIDEEAKFQEELRQLRERFLLNLEDALHERDARAVIRLVRTYAMDKENLTNEYLLRKRQGEIEHQDDLERIRRETADRLAELDKERALKLARMKEDFEIKRKREIAEHQLEMRRLEEEKRDRLQQLATSLQEQLGLTEQGGKAIFDLLNSYFGPSGGIDEMMKWTYDNTTAYMKSLMEQLLDFYNKYKLVVTEINNLPTKKNTHIYPGQQPPATQGVSTNSVATASGMSGFIPINQLSSLFGGNTVYERSVGSGNGKINIDLTLSPDLETRVVQKSLDEMAGVIMNVRKAR